MDAREAARLATYGGPCFGCGGHVSRFYYCCSVNICEFCARPNPFDGTPPAHPSPRFHLKQKRGP